MSIRHIVIAAATVAALSPALSNASPERTSVKACASAFATAMAAPGASAPTYKVSYHGAMGSSLTTFYPSDYTFTLEAKDSKTGAPIARARCSTDSHGTVTEIATIPLHADASLASSY